MKKSIIIVLIATAIYSCKSDPKKQTEPAIQKEVLANLSTTEKIAQTAGMENWDEVKEVKFTFDVGKMGQTIYAREWTWNRETDDVTLIAPPDTVNFNRKNLLTDREISADRTFTNDIYWLIPEFKFMTDQGTQIIEKTGARAPISKDSLDMFTIVYGNEGGYTPGDGYDVYYDQDHNLREWVYRQKNDTVVGMMNTFEKFETINGIKVATDHRTPDRMTRIFLRNIEFNK